MAIKYAVQDGLWSATSTWDGGTVPRNGDLVYSDGKNITIDINLTGTNRPSAIYTAAKPSGGTPGGSFIINANRTIGESTNPVNIFSGTSPVGCQGIVISGSNPTVTIYGNITGGFFPKNVSITNISGNLTIHGNVSGGFANQAYGVANYASTSAVTINGNITAGASHAIYHEGTSMQINGNVTGGNRAGVAAIFHNSSGNLIINGNVTGGSASGSHGLVVSKNNGSLTITGDVQGGTAMFSFGIYAGGNDQPTLYIQVNGNVTSGSGPSAFGVFMLAKGTLHINGNVTANMAPGVYSQTDAKLIITGDCTANLTPAVFWTGILSYCYVGGNQYGSHTGQGRGCVAVVSYRMAMPNTGNPTIRFARVGALGEYDINGNPVILSRNSTSGFPAPADVRNGVTYGPSNEYTGTCAVPSAQHVAYGVPVDNTTGTAILTPESAKQAIWADQVIDSSLSARQVLSLLAAAILGRTTGMGTNSVTYKAIGGTADRAQVTLDGNNNRTDVTLNPPT
jgi:hypothetical protein